MGIDYVVDLDCQPKKTLSTNKIIALVKGQNQAAVIIEAARSRGDQRPIEQLSFTRMVMRPEGPTEQEVSVGALLKQSEELREHEHSCQGCKANLPNQPFGCYGSVSYPLSIRAEEWLMSLLPKELKSAAGHLLYRAVKDFKYDGGMFLDMRPQAIFFESRTPLKRKWGSFLSSWTLTSDQLLQMLFGLGNLQPSHCKTMSVILGMIPTEPSSEPPPPLESGDKAEQLAHAINAVALAGELGVNLLVDA
jgi:hypothetical protein